MLGSENKVLKFKFVSNIHLNSHANLYITPMDSRKNQSSTMFEPQSRNTLSSQIAFIHFLSHWWSEHIQHSWQGWISGWRSSIVGVCWFNCIYSTTLRLLLCCFHVWESTVNNQQLDRDSSLLFTVLVQHLGQWHKHSPSLALLISVAEPGFFFFFCQWPQLSKSPTHTYTSV